MSFSRSLQSDAYAVWGLYCSHAAYCPFHMVEGLDVAMRGAGGGGGGGEGWGKGSGKYNVVICCRGGEMYCSAWRLAPRISYIMSVQRLIILLTGAMLLETTYRRKCHIIGQLTPAVTGINVFV